MVVFNYKKTHGNINEGTERVLIRAYLFIYNFFEATLDLIRSLQFVWTLNKKHVFKNKNTEDILKVINTFTLSEVSTYPNKVKMGRDITSSTALLSVLIDLYLENHSEVHLEQLLEVLKNEFIRREID